MSAYFWLCTTGCQWQSRDDYQMAVTQGFTGTLSASPYTRPIDLGINDAFCMFALHKNELQGGNVYSAAFALKPKSPSIALYLWGHHDGTNGRYFLMIVGNQSSMHLNAQARPPEFKQKGGPYTTFIYTDIQSVAGNMS